MPRTNSPGGNAVSILPPGFVFNFMRSVIGKILPPAFLLTFASVQAPAQVEGMVEEVPRQLEAVRQLVADVVESDDWATTPGTPVELPGVERAMLYDEIVYAGDAPPSDPLPDSYWFSNASA